MGKQKKRKQNIQNPHDRFFKDTFSMIEVVQDYLKNFLPQNISQKLNMNSLTQVSNLFISESLSEYFADLIWKGELNNGSELNIAFLFEHKSYKPQFVHIQILRYMIEIWEQNIKNEEDLIPIFPIIVYHGSEKWEIKPFESYFKNFDEELLPYFPKFDFWLTDLNNYSDEIIHEFQIGFLKKIFLTFKHHHEQKYLRENITQLILFDNDYELEKYKNDRFFNVFILYLYNIIDLDADEFIDIISDIPEPIKSKTMTIWESAIDKGEKKGIEKGIEKEKRDTVITAYQKGASVEFIAEITRLTIQQVRDIIAEFNIKQ